jgi:glycosyltransferase involved in cell wall biosynthesis
LQRILEQDYGPKISWIPNGYFPRKKTHGRKHQSSRFTISYTGQIYDKRQDIGSFLDALNTLVLEQKADRSRLVFRYYGSSGSIVLRHRYKWPDLFSTNVEINDQVPLEESYRLQDGSDMLLLLNWNDPLEKGIATTKLNEYLSTGVPILATGGFSGDYVEYILKLTGAGYYCPTKEQIVLRLAKAYREYIEKGYVSMDREISNTRDFCYDHLAQKLAMVLSGLLFRHGFKEHR